MTLIEAITDTRNVKEVPTEELKAQLEEMRKAKMWRGRYFAVDRELQDRATREWVKSDVFGHTFDGAQ